MNNWFLFFILIILYGVSYIIHKRHFCASYILILTMLIPVTTLVLLQSYIQYELSLETIAVITLLIVLFQIGEIIVSRRGISIQKENARCNNLVIKKRYKYLPTLIQILNLIVVYRYLMQVGAQYGADNILSAYAANRINTFELQTTGEANVSPSFINIFMTTLASCIEIICLHIALVQKIIWKQKIDKWLILPIILFFVSLLFESGRAPMVPVIVHFAYLYFLLSNLSLSLLLRRHFFKIVLFICAVGVFFIAAGSIRDQSNIKDSSNIEVIDPLDAFAMYVGGPIVGLDIYVRKGLPEYPNMGEQLFKPFYDIMRKIGFKFERPRLHEEKFYLKKMETNVFTGFCYWIKDFSLIGAFIYSFVLGLIFGYIHLLEINKRIRLDNIIGRYYISIFYWGLVMVFFNNALRNILSIETFFKIIILFVLIKIMVKRKVPYGSSI